jgi:hypothetical protein
LSQADVAFWAFNGKASSPSPVPSPASGPSPISIRRACTSSCIPTAKIKSIADLRSKRVGFGPKNAGNMLTAGLVLKGLGLSEKRLKPDYSDSAPPSASSRPASSMR